MHALGDLNFSFVLGLIFIVSSSGGGSARGTIGTEEVSPSKSKAR